MRRRLGTMKSFPPKVTPFHFFSITCKQEQKPRNRMIFLTMCGNNIPETMCGRQNPKSWWTDPPSQWRSWCHWTAGRWPLPCDSSVCAYIFLQRVRHSRQHGGENKWTRLQSIATLWCCSSIFGILTSRWRYRLHSNAYHSHKDCMYNLRFTTISKSPIAHSTEIYPACLPACPTKMNSCPQMYFETA